jgi:NAD(P)-dependent dehydrogenase (short-subunit alcohol dehydrogenase family)
LRRLEGSRAIVTGAASGIGLAIAQRFLAEGARVVFAYRSQESAESVDDTDNVLAHKVDVSREDDVRALIDRAVEVWDGLDVMVNNAGIGLASTTPETSERDWDRVMNVNLKGVFFGMKHAIPAVRDFGGGSVINICSTAALVGVPNRAAYSASKGGVMALTRAAAIDHVAEEVRVNCILPGTTETPWVTRITADVEDPAASRANMQARQPHGRFVRPQEVAALAAYLASDESASVIGAAMVIDGGMTAR